MSTSPKGQSTEWRYTPEAEETGQRFATIVTRTLDHVTAGRLVTARFSLTHALVLRMLVGVPMEHLRFTVSAVTRVQSNLSEECHAVDQAKAELVALGEFWTDGWRDPGLDGAGG